MSLKLFCASKTCSKSQAKMGAEIIRFLFFMFRKSNIRMIKKTEE